MMSVRVLTCSTSGWVSYHSAKRSTSRKNSGSLMPPVSPLPREYSIVYRPVRFLVAKSVDRLKSTVSSKYLMNSSLSSLRGRKETSAMTRIPIPQNRKLRRATTNSANRSTICVLRSEPAFTRIGSTSISAGKKVTEKTNAPATPMATIFPRSLKGGASLKFILRNPITVVNDVRKMGCRLIRRLSITALVLSCPCRMACRRLTRICTQSATASVRIIVGEDADGGVKAISSQPDSPIANAMENTMTRKVPTVAVIDRSSRARVNSTTPNIIGTSVC